MWFIGSPRHRAREGNPVSVTTIKVTPQTRDRLKALGTKGETYDALVNRLLDEIEAHTVRVTEAAR